MKDDQLPDYLTKQVSRRSLLKGIGLGGAGVLLATSGVGSALALTDQFPDILGKNNSKNKINFYGTHQAGITTEQQNHLYFASLNITTSNKADLISLFKKWTEAAAAMTSGEAIGQPAKNGLLPPDDTGEVAGLSASNLTITFGVGPTFFEKEGKDRFGLLHKKPAELKDLPKFPLDALEERWTGGDICIQACSDDMQVAFHAVRNLVRIARGKAVLHFTQSGFLRSKQSSGKNETPRNLFGFKDGTINPNLKDKQELNEQVWVQRGDGPNWLIGGSYLVVRRIQMFIEVWDRTTLKDQEETFGRHRDSGAPLSKKNEFDQVDLEEKNENGQYVIPKTSHVRVAHGKGKEQILRRAYSYADGMDLKTGTFDAGLFFMSYQRKPSKQFVPMQQRLAQMDKLNEYIVHKGSAVFACLPGVKKGGFIGETLF
ncbi:iron uptake transporter deferrochelatase/peroxidase subunit [Metabacillus fastidiosus]|uniref:Deferrochelatase n=1 Tax=Metabacillus fastidiosus TaxID=1458 RepID=A0ABU6P350_9BACI|nr:iron uptake transporter deferrochelatase/peroxidase subunit [Metabacillus fastidiosus]MED4403789.1 iron uptake transporter deferrochelatase/peroxidase subunit [Metabacillus fastidiosus]MED4452569.1 iron uptake transporter deferrochelatase/peroxidase subunit [Metabacillus fastidiosus]